MTKTIETPSCFGKLFDGTIDDCKVCNENARCQQMMVPTTAATPVEATTTPDPESPTPVAADGGETAGDDMELTVDEMLADEEEAAAKVAAAQALAEEAAKPKRKGRPKKTKPATTEAKPKTDGETTRTRTALKMAAFTKDDKGNLVFAPGLPPKPDLIVNAGDIVKIINPRSKFNGQEFVVSCYSEKYECFRGTQPATKIAADFLPHQIEVIQRAATA